MRVLQTTSGILSLLLVSPVAFAIEKTTVISDKAKVLEGTGFSDPNVAGNLIQTTLGLLLVIAIIGAAAWLFKRFGHIQIGVQGRMKIIGGVSLGTRERAVLLQVGDEQLVVGVAPGRIQTLHVLKTPLPIEEKKTTDTSNFATRLQSAIAKRKVNSPVDGEH